LLLSFDINVYVTFDLSVVQLTTDALSSYASEERTTSEPCVARVWASLRRCPKPEPYESYPAGVSEPPISAWLGFRSGGKRSNGQISGAMWSRRRASGRTSSCVRSRSAFQDAVVHRSVLSWKFHRLSDARTPADAPLPITSRSSRIGAAISDPAAGAGSSGEVTGAAGQESVLCRICQRMVRLTLVAGISLAKYPGECERQRLSPALIFRPPRRDTAGASSRPALRHTGRCKRRKAARPALPRH
jgi:hypothetical protein